MDQVKFARFLCEFPFLVDIGVQQCISADSIEGIKVERGDQDLMRAKPHAWLHDAGGSYGAHMGHHFYWCVTANKEVIALKSAWHRTIPHHRNDYVNVAAIGYQLLGLSLKHKIEFIVETHEERWDWDEHTENIIIYKMHDFDWEWLFAGTNLAGSTK